MIKPKIISQAEALERRGARAFGYLIRKRGMVVIYRQDGYGTFGVVHRLADVRDFLKIRFLFDPAERVPGTEVIMSEKGTLRVVDGPTAARIGRPPVAEAPLTPVERMRRMRARRREQASAIKAVPPKKGKPS